MINLKLQINQGVIVDINVMHLGKENKHDHRFYSRWLEIGLVSKRPHTGMKNILVVDQHIKVDKDLLNDIPNLLCVVSPTTGHTHLQFTNYPIISLRGETEFLQSIRGVSEKVFQEILNFYKEDGPMRTLGGKNIVVLGGYGRIGAHICKLAEAFGMNVYPFDFIDIFPAISKELKKALAIADIFTVHCNETEQNKGLVNKDWFELLPSKCFFINTARGSIVNEEDMIRALKKKRLAKVYVDVIEDYSPFKMLMRHNIKITPHIAGSSIEDRIRTDDFILNKTKKWLRGNT